MLSANNYAHRKESRYTTFGKGNFAGDINMNNKIYSHRKFQTFLLKKRGINPS